MTHSPIALRRAVELALDKRKAEGSLLEFTRQAWSIIEPGNQFRNNWHIEAVAQHLEAVYNGDINNLLINIPPGSMKSILVSVMWPAWMWINDPSLRILNASYGEDLAVRDARKTRDIITSEWFQERWPQVQIVKGDDQKTKYSLTERGWRMATSVGGRATGEHPDIKIVDDPHSAKQASSDAERQTALDWFDTTLSTRGVSRGARTVVVMQRLHEQDISGHIINDLSDYEHLFLPMRYEKATAKRRTLLGFSDPRTVEGELLWPAMFPEKVLVKLEASLGQYGTAGQLQQRPAPAGGGILKTEFLQLWPASKTLPDFTCVIQSWDTAFTQKTTGDPSACTTWGAFTHEGRQCAMLLDARADHMSYPDLKKAVIEDWGAVYGENKRHADFVLVEKKASGQSIIQDLQVAGIPVRAYNPGRADKVTRAHMMAPILEMGVLYLLESFAEPGKPVKWARPFVKELEDFPNGAHDDMTDTASQCIIYMRDANMIASLAAEPDEEEPLEYGAKRRADNPYSQ